jgi:hypothetical protein
MMLGSARREGLSLAQNAGEEGMLRYMRHHSTVALFVPKSASPGSGKSRLLDATGRRVLGLKSGPNDVNRLSPGVHFVREVRAHARAQVLSKVIVTR